jgi:thioredoxin-like negative regulator of GroEL
VLIFSKSKYCLIHFYHPDFARCRIMHQKLEELAPKYPHTLFLRTSVGDAPFLVNKLGVQVLPCVHVFVDSKGVDR